MMSPDQSRVVAEVYRRFMAGEDDAGWDDLDDQMVYLEYLEDDQLHREADVLFSIHSKKTISCSNEFCNQGCYANTVVEAVGYILELYKNTNNLHANNRYILEYYLALSQIGMIISS